VCASERRSDKPLGGGVKPPRDAGRGSQATALGLATVAIGVFHDERVREIIGAPPEEHVLYMMPLAKPRKPYSLKLEDLARYIVERRRTGRT
jgi:hypothetical protein